MSVPYAINASLNYPNKVKGLIIGDYPARISTPPKGWAEKVVESSFVDKSREHVAVALEQELKETDLTNQLANIKCSALVIKG